MKMKARFFLSLWLMVAIWKQFLSLSVAWSEHVYGWKNNPATTTRRIPSALYVVIAAFSKCKKSFQEPLHEGCIVMVKGTWGAKLLRGLFTISLNQDTPYNAQFDIFAVWLTKFPRDQVNSYGVNLQVSWRKIWLLDSNIGPNSNWICLNDFFVGWHRSWISEMAKITTIDCKKSNFRSNFKNIFINKPVINFGLFSPHTREIIW